MLTLVKPKAAKVQCAEINSMKLIKKTLNANNLQRMFAICRDHDAAGIAAPQLGLYLKFFLGFIPDLEYWGIFINPEYVKTGEEVDFVEGCLTIKNKQFTVKRSNKVLARWQEYIDEYEKIIDKEEELTDVSAFIFQHETDHCNQILISDIGEEICASEEK